MSRYNPHGHEGPMFGTINGTRGRRIHIVEVADPFHVESFCGQVLTEIVDRDNEAQRALLDGKPWPENVDVPEKCCPQCLKAFRAYT